MLRSLWTTLLFLLAVAGVGATSAVSSQSNRRRLESSSALHYGACFNVKEYDDEDADDDGNSYFYNGAYRAAYSKYASFFLCSNGGGKDGSMLEDSNCDGPYVTDLGTYMQTMALFSESYCNACLNNCRRRQLQPQHRRLEDEEENDDGQANVNAVPNCNTCKDECTMMWQDQGNYDAQEDFQCQEAAADGNDNGDEDEEENNQYYSGPQCVSGEIAIGAFYDEDCMFKTSQVFDSDSSTLKTIEAMFVDCDNNAETCEDLEQMAFSCNDNQDSICKAANSALRTRTYYTKPWYSKFPFGIILFALLLSGGLAFLSYTYFVRHTSTHRTPMADLDGKTGSPTADRSLSPSKQGGTASNSSSNLPPIT